MLQSDHLKELQELRHDLHRHPELSGAEVNTAKMITAYLSQYETSAVIEKLGGYGVAALFDSGVAGPTTLIRCELDALPIQENNPGLAYASETPWVAHKCGHDGHMAIVSGLARLLSQHPPTKGKVVLLYQPAEETGQGARAIIQDPRFDSIKPDFAFSLHNLPGFEQGQILIRDETFCAASCGIRINLSGKTAHASHPETGISPALAVSQLIPELINLPNDHEFEDFVLVTLTHTQIGEKTFGVSPGNAEIYLTIRAYLDEDLAKLKSLIENKVDTVASDLEPKITEHEAFDATSNHSEQADLVRKVASEVGLKALEMQTPNRWSEDFGLFLQQCKGAMFGLGSGIDQPALHNPDYDFPDDLIESGIKMFWGIIQEVNF